jgi:hypothetical protein
MAQPPAHSSLPPPPVGRDDGCTCSLNLGTFWGPHVVRDREQPARLCTLRTAAHWPSTVGDLRNALPLFTGGQVVRAVEGGSTAEFVTNGWPRSAGRRC